MGIKWFGLTDHYGEPFANSPLIEQEMFTIQWFQDLEALLETLKTETGGVGLFLETCPNYDVFDITRSFTAQFPKVAVILLTNEPILDLKMAMHAGATDVLGIQATKEEIRSAMRAVEKAIHLKESLQFNLGIEKRKTEVLTICSTKGGVGKTTFSVNLGLALAKQNLNVVLVDLDLQFGDISLLLDIKPPKTMYEWIKADHLAEDKLSQYVYNYKGLIDVLPSPIRPEFSEVITGDHIGQMISLLKKHYDFIVIDTAPNIVETILVALEHSDHILNILNFDLPTFKNNKLFIETLETLGLKDKTKLILNKETKVTGMDVKSIPQILTLDLFGSIPLDRKVVPQSVNEGNPFVLSHPRLAASRSIYKLADLLIHPPKEANEPKKVKKPKVNNWKKVKA